MAGQASYRTGKLFAAALLVGLLALISCGPAEVATPTATPIPKPVSGSATPTPTIFVPPSLLLPTPTPTPLPGVTATPTPTATPIPAADKPKYGGVLRFAGNPPQPTLDTYNAVGSNWGGILAASNLWGQLIRVSAKDRRTIEPEIAESWTVSADGNTWKLKIRPGVLTHEGEPYTVQDAYWQLVRVIERPNKLLTTRQSCMRAYVKKIWDDSKQPLPNGGAEVTGPNELTIRLIAPGAGFVACFTGYSQVTQPAKYVKAIDMDPSGKTRDLDFKKGEYVGMGPFMLKDIQPDNIFTMKRFDRYFRPGLPYMDEISLVQISEQSAWEAAFSIGRIDFVSTSVGPFFISDNSLVQMKKTLGDTVAFPLVQAMGVCGFDVNLRKPPFGPPEDPTARKIRQAMQFALDRGEVNDLIYEGKAHLAPPYYIGWSWIYTEKEWLEQYRGIDSTPAAKARDIADAQKLMQEAGYGPNNRLKVQMMSSSSRSEETQLVGKQMAKIYWDVTPIVNPDSTATARRGVFDLNQFCNGTNFPDPDSYNFDIHLQWEEGGQNPSSWTHPGWRELGLKQAILSNNAERAPILRQMARIWHDEALRIGILRPTMPFGYRTYVKNYFSPPYHFINFPMEEVWLSK